MEFKRGSKLILCLLTGCVGSAFAESIPVKTSDTLRELGQKLTDAYAAKHADTKFEVTSSATADIFTALADRKTKLVLAPRSIRFKEAQACEAAFGSRPTETKVAVNGAAVYVNASNPVKVLIYDEIEAAFKGKHTNWKRLGGSDAPVSLYGVATNTPAGELFVAEVLNGSAPTNTTHLVAPKELLANIARDTNSLAFGPFVNADGARPLEIKRSYSSTPVTPTEDAIASKIFPITRFVFCYVEPAANKDEIKSFLDWLHSDEAQQVSKQAGFFPLPAKWRQ